MANRVDGRRPDQLRPLRITRNYLKWPEGSVLIEQGNTKIICTASVEDGVPRFLANSGQGWITAEYSMLPRATDTRMRRDRGNQVSGRTQEIQRLIGRALRGAFDMNTLGERTYRIDADVIQADGGTRCASITGSFVALYDAILKKRSTPPKINPVAALSLGIFNNHVLTDLCYHEDSSAEVDFNFVSVVENGELKFVEIQGTAERQNFSRAVFGELMDAAEVGLKKIVKFLGDVTADPRQQVFEYID